WFTLDSLPAANTQLTLYGNGSVNSLTGPDMANNWLLNGLNMGVLDGTVSFFGMQSLTGGSKSDEFWFAGSNAGVSDKIDGGSGMDTFQFSVGASIAAIDGGAASGGDWLDYSLFGPNNPVTVNLMTGQATGVLASAANIQNVLGGGGNDTLTGSLSGSVLIGGAGTDNLTGSAG